MFFNKHSVPGAEEECDFKLSARNFGSDPVDAIEIQNDKVDNHDYIESEVSKLPVGAGCANKPG